jgi:hypothetical protein
VIDHDHPNEQRATFVWSKVRPRFHVPHCRWARKILPTNWRAGDTVEPIDGEPRRPCKVCSPSPTAADAT